MVGEIASLNISFHDYLFATLLVIVIYFNAAGLLKNIKDVIFKTNYFPGNKIFSGN